MASKSKSLQHRLRGLFVHFETLTNDYAFRGAMKPQDADYVEDEYKRARENLLKAIHEVEQ